MTDMNTIEINEPLDRSWIVTLIGEGYTTYNIVQNYNLTEDLILNCTDLLDKEVILEGFSFSENFINKALEVGYFDNSDIKNLSMKSYINLSEDFITKYNEYINWNKLIIYESTQSDTFDKYISIIEKNNLWSIISANDLSVDFIRHWKDNLDWTYLSMVKCFTEEEKQEFSDYIVTPDSNVGSGDFIDNSQFEFVKNMSNDELEELIDQINKHLYKQSN